MFDFYNSLKAIEKIFFISAALGGAIFIVRLILSFVGADSDSDGDFDGDLGGEAGADSDVDIDDSDSSFKILSLQGITAFFMMFGLVGLAVSKQSKMSEFVSIIGGAFAGFFAVWVIGKIMVGMKKLQSDGTLKIKNALGQEGVVYLTIPKEGKGKVHIAIQGSLREMDALSVDNKEIKTGAKVVVKEIFSDNLLKVEKI